MFSPKALLFTHVHLKLPAHAFGNQEIAQLAFAEKTVLEGINPTALKVPHQQDPLSINFFYGRPVHHLLPAFSGLEALNGMSDIIGLHGKVDCIRVFIHDLNAGHLLHRTGDRHHEGK